jgi:hypothetical protein
MKDAKPFEPLDVDVRGTRAWRERQEAKQRKMQWCRIVGGFILGAASIVGAAVLMVVGNNVGPAPGRSSTETCKVGKKQTVTPGDDYRCNPLYLKYTYASSALFVVGGILTIVVVCVGISKRRDERRR